MKERKRLFHSLIFPYFSASPLECEFPKNRCHCHLSQHLQLQVALAEQRGLMTLCVCGGWRARVGGGRERFEVQEQVECEVKILLTKTCPCSHGNMLFPHSAAFLPLVPTPTAAFSLITMLLRMMRV